MKNLLLVLVCLAILGMTVSVCQGAERKVIIVNKSGKTVNVAAAIRVSPGNAKYKFFDCVYGWVTVAPGETLELPQRGGEFFIHCSMGGQEYQFKQFKTKRTYWCHPTDRFEGCIGYSNEPRSKYLYGDIMFGKKVYDEVFKEGEREGVTASNTRVPSVIRWGKPGDYTGVGGLKFANSQDLGGNPNEALDIRYKKDLLLLKGFGWKIRAFSQVPVSTEKDTKIVIEPKN